MIPVDVTFVILTWNSDKYIKDCINSIAFSLKESSLSYDIFIVDNGSQDDTVEILKSLDAKYSNINIILLNENTGTTYSRNRALEKANGRYVCIMDSDVEIFPDTIQGLLQTLEENDKTGLVVPKILYPSGKLQKSTDMFPTVTRKIFRYLFLKKMEEKEAQEDSLSTPVKVDYAISACWVFKKELIDKVGLLDENIFYAPEDVDYCLRIWKAGYEIIYTPLVKIVHHTQEISRGMKINDAFINHVKGLIYYFIKHRYFFIPPSFVK